jgi:hypothetical protein
MVGRYPVEKLKEISSESKNRFELCASILNAVEAKEFDEIGVWKGEFAAWILHNCPSILRYFMIDPWISLSNWNKPANVSDEDFQEIFQEAMANTNFASEKRRVVMARSIFAASHFEDESLDAVYIDGDHTLRGITLDLMSFYDKVSDTGIILGDDFTPSIWQHDRRYEPSLVFPFAVHFAEAKRDRIYGLPFNQFMIEKSDAFEFVDLTGKYDNIELRDQLC